jgi:hypothetical protein
LPGNAAHGGIGGAQGLAIGRSEARFLLPPQDFRSIRNDAIPAVSDTLRGNESGLMGSKKGSKPSGDATPVGSPSGMGGRRF